jgi:2-polyprenyl-3-methyl-5-hydroxy-6-metoxy-1,4-benzoquinol methylase
MDRHPKSYTDSTHDLGTTDTWALRALDETDPDAQLAARLEPFDSYWQAPENVEKGYSSFYAYYAANYTAKMPADKNAHVLVISCGPGYLVHTLNRFGYGNVLGIDSNDEKVSHARRRDLNCKTARAFRFLQQTKESFDVIIPEQELNHLTHSEQISFLRLCAERLRPGGRVIAYGLNGANPFVGSENLAHNIDHFNTFTEYSLGQILELGGFTRIEAFPLKIYVFWRNPLNYVGLLVTGAFELLFRIMFKLYGKNVKILSKKVAAVAFKQD